MRELNGHGWELSPSDDLPRVEKQSVAVKALKSYEEANRVAWQTRVCV